MLEDDKCLKMTEKVCDGKNEKERETEMREEQKREDGGRR